MSSPTPLDPDDPYAPYLQTIAAQAVRMSARMEEWQAKAESVQEAERASAAWGKITRGLRQTLALDARLKRERQAFRRDFGPQMERDHAQKVVARRTEVHEAVEQLIWTEYEKPEDIGEANFMIGELFELLECEAEKPAFLDEPVALQIRRIIHMLALDDHGRPDEALAAELEAQMPRPPPSADSS